MTAHVRPSKLRDRGRHGDDDEETCNKVGNWSRERLIKMDARFAAAMERALARRRPLERK